MNEKQGTHKTRKQTIFRTIKDKDNPFVMIDRRPIENPKLSWKAKGILAYLLSRPDNWIVRLTDLVNRSPDGVYAIRGAINELKKAGHVSSKEVRDGEGKFLRYELEVYELPFTSKPLINFPQADNPQADNLMLNDTDNNEKNKQQEEEGAPGKNVFQLYEEEVGLLTPMIADTLKAWEKDVPEQWIADAIREAVKNGKRNLSYIEAILKRWHAQKSQEPSRKAQSKKKSSVPSAFDAVQQWLEKQDGEFVNG